MKKLKLLIIPLLLLASCKGSTTPSDSSSSNVVSSDVSSSEVTSSDISSSEITSSDISSSDISSSDASDSSTSLPQMEGVLSISEVNDAISLLDKDSKGTTVTFNGTYFSNYNETRGAQSRLMYFADSTGYIYVETTLDIAEKKMNFFTSYQITGIIANDYGHYEVELISYKSIPTLSDVNAKTHSREMDLKTIHEEIAKLPLDSKGISFAEMVTFEAQYIAKMDNAVLLFSDGTNVVHLHSGENKYTDWDPSKIGNKFMLNKHYQITALIGQYINRPSLQLVEWQYLDISEEFQVQKYKDVKAWDIAKMGADTSREQSQFYPYILKMTCYVRLNTKNQSKYVYALVDNFKDRIAWQSTSMLNQSLFVRNTEEYAVIDLLSTICDKEIQIELYFVLYNYITSPQAWNIYLLGAID